jgi:hypothetical protein
LSLVCSNGPMHHIIMSTVAMKHQDQIDNLHPVKIQHHQFLCSSQ